MFSASIGSRGGRYLCHPSTVQLRPRPSHRRYRPLQLASRLSPRISGQPLPEKWAVCKENEAFYGQSTSIQSRRPFTSSASALDASSSSSVSPSEVAHFSRLASSWWDPHGPSRLLHLMNPLRHDFIRSCLASATASDSQQYSYLDVGCGGGIFASSVARLPSTSIITAIDPTPECIAVAQDKQRSDPGLQPPKLTYLNCAIENIPTQVEKVDIITLFEVLEHISHPAVFLAECVKHLKAGGWMIGSTIARSPMSFLTTKVIAEAPVVGIVPRGTHDWNKYINPEELKQWFDAKAAGAWEDFKTQGVVYVPLAGWKVVQGSERWGNYFFGVQKVG